MVELPPAVVGDVDDLHAVLDGDFGILRGSNALEGQRQVVLVLVALHLVPGERGLELHAGPVDRAPRLGEAAGEVALAPAVMRAVHGEAEPGEAIGQRALHEIVDPGIVAAYVELEDADRVGRGSRGFEPGLAHGGEHLRDAELRSAARRIGGRALRKRFHAAYGREHHRQAHLLAHECRGRIYLAHVVEHARAERDSIERLAVAAHRGLGFGGAGEVVPGARRELAAGGGDDFLQGEELLFCVHGAKPITV